MIIVHIFLRFANLLAVRLWNHEVVGLLRNLCCCMHEPPQHWLLWRRCEKHNFVKCWPLLPALLWRNWGWPGFGFGCKRQLHMAFFWPLVWLQRICQNRIQSWIFWRKKWQVWRRVIGLRMWHEDHIHTSQPLGSAGARHCLFGRRWAPLLVSCFAFLVF